ncbi:hypothetical protein ABL78_5187 [Leptomonas seymouri]|uniref:Uncharacterized protein n=1 Tax=Leptomonas seymouri TaxID=5684 RepID=A0A0N1HVI4_LEPSE|nr:hypothetical protein ABL78_5187 [Leptomonas seymouri]|eukprot:KPI85738.1 hypothetical protein ABL78_5187 [Leptomonas seymouri]
MLTPLTRDGAAEEEAPSTLAPPPYPQPSQQGLPQFAYYPPHLQQQQTQAPMAMYLYMYPSMLTPENPQPPFPSLPGAQPSSELHEQPQEVDAQPQQLQQMQMHTQMVYPYMYPSVSPLGGSASPISPSVGLQPDRQLVENAQDPLPQQLQQDSPHQQEQQPQPPHPVPMYAPWSAALQQNPPPVMLANHPLAPAPGVPPPPTTALGYAQGTPTLNLGLRARTAPPKRILTFYASLFMLLIATELLLVGAWLTPASHDQIFFTRPTTDVLEGDTYENVIGGALGLMISDYAHYAPCTALKRYGCEVLGWDFVSQWFQDVTAGMQKPFPELFDYSNLSRTTMRSCTYFVKASSPLHTSSTENHSSSDYDRLLQSEVLYQRTPDKLYNSVVGCSTPHSRCAKPGVSPTHSVSDIPEGPEKLSEGSYSPMSAVPALPSCKACHTPPRTVAQKKAPLLKVRSATPEAGLWIGLHSTFPSEMLAAFSVTCNSDWSTEDMLNLTRVSYINITDFVPKDYAGVFYPLAANDFFAAATDSFIDYTFSDNFNNCAQYYLVCDAPYTYVLLVSRGELRRCGGGPVAVDSDVAATPATVIVCSTVPREIDADPNKSGDLYFTARGAFAVRLTVRAQSVSLPSTHRSFETTLHTSTIIFFIAQALIPLNAALVLIAGLLIPLQRSKLRQLRAALEVDASVAMEILYRVQGALNTAPLTAPPPTESAVVQPQMPPSSMYVAPPFHQSAAGMAMMQAGGALMMVRPHLDTQPPLSPYGEGHYMAQPGEAESSNTAVAEVSSVHTTAHHQTDAVAKPQEAPTASREDISSDEQRRSESAKEDNAVFEASDGLVSPAEIVLSTVTLVKPQQGRDAQELGSLYSTASLPSSVRSGGSVGGGPASAVAGAPMSSVEAGSATRPHASPPSPEEQQRGRISPTPLSGDAMVGAAGHGRMMMTPTVQPPPALLAEAPPNSDWMFSQRRHLVSPTALEVRTPSAKSCLQKLLDRILRHSVHRRSAAVRANFPCSDTDGDDEDDAAAAADRNYAGPESSPGERTIQLFVSRARNSYRRVRRRQTKVISTIFLVVGIVLIMDTMLIAIAMGLQISGLFVDFSARLQQRAGDTLTMTRSVSGAQIGLFVLALVCSVLSIAFCTLIQSKSVW